MQYLILFLEGMITFISPCLLPMLPIYISYFAGGEGNRKKTVLGAIGFVLGFSAVFMLLGALAGTVGSFLREYGTVVNIVSGILIIFFGMSFLGVFRLPFFQGKGRLSTAENMSFLKSMLFGVIFSLGWTPCVGAFLASALVMASRQGQTIQGILMLFVYSLGLGIPFVASAILIDSLKSTFDFIKRNYRTINLISGAFLILIGILMAAGLFGRFLSVLS
ncbi:MAG: sulfite exporter TauE/SafE family protein [Clostridia bacterium]|nr:sulfite exporter TauE/SafE family protein [Clostridia bacterium]MBQ2433521.1 sulfite exporter TauE/SafE family protein [Clostridia bacterium]MBQ5769814.1 sulfite exporter TauE/SafE family protein [Clostridia bacterium]